MGFELLNLFKEINEIKVTFIAISKHDLPALLPVLKDCSGKIFRDFQKEGIIGIEDLVIELLNPEAFRMIQSVGRKYIYSFIQILRNSSTNISHSNQDILS